MAKQDPRRRRRQSTDERAGPGRPALDLASSGDVRSAITHLRANLHRAVPMAELAAQTGVSERTLRDHFHRFLRVSPPAYGLRLRLNAVRHELQRWSNTEPIASIAQCYGFPRFDRFARQYRLAFGEVPSATRQAAAPGRGMMTPAPRRGRPDILVQPFAAPPGLADLAGVLMERIAIALLGEARIFRAPPAMRPPRQRDLTARYRIEGHLAAAGERFQMMVRLIDSETDTQLWADAWSGLAADAFPAIEHAVAAVAGAVLPAIRRTESERVKELRPQDMDAYQLCLRAYPLLAGNTAANARHALDLLHRAIERDPDYALANALTAWGYAQLVMQHGTTSPVEDRAEALRFSTRAGMLDQDDAMVLTARSVVHTMTDDRLYADDLVTRALARDPRLGWAWGAPGLASRLCGRHEWRHGIIWPGVTT